jgi:hypothetical protein
VYCDSHTNIEGYDHQHGGTPISSGVYAVLRHDGAAELIPAGKVRVSEKPAPSPALGVQAADVILEFPE